MCHDMADESVPQMDGSEPDGGQQPVNRRFSGAAVFGAAVAGGVIGALLMTAVVLAFVGLGGSRDPGADQAPARGDTVTIDASDLDMSFAEAVAMKVTPSVVNIALQQQVLDPFTGRRSTQSVGNGSGVIIREDGYILTNNHVVADADSIVVTVGSEDLPATVVGTDPSSDLAVIKVDDTGLTPIEIGSSADLSVGEPVVAIGSPFGLERTVTAGIVSALGRSSLAEGPEGFTAYTSLIQTDASINPGNSGGALCDAEGKLIGINTLIQSTTGQSAGIGFAIPVDLAIGIADELIADGTVDHPFLGVATLTVDANTAEAVGSPVDAGAIIQRVVEGSPAEQAGLERGDILVRIADTEVRSVEDVFAAIRAQSVGDTVEVEFYRGTESRVVEVTLASDAGQ